ncbi:conserved hypothetical protein [Histoplasma capsulatum G186AR]|uniref:Rhomboid family membrane protein n=2 Tax=Ajellomyces capsulatus TaxID=5037 RepID=C0NWE1_AJECG|nr:uncharacterized protein HCBG_07471 [Histoplasma capsulatum G186AR]EEH04246.1 conserved hypothetical protein [Histoplasma capsulatum G186AR]KAG5291199.1 hypothetical protein I7I52_08456 [Histoplasma capsulatum]QSS68502.1 hypothetical protein I7I50_07940 [Histoplasma capsulatum G186AR]
MAPADSSAPQSSSSTTTTATHPVRDRKADYEKFKNFAAYTFLFASPVFIALPPRKLDFYTFSLGAAFLVSANRISSIHTGSSIVGQLRSRTVGENRPTVFRDLPTPQAEAMQAQLRAVREAEMREGNIVGQELERWKQRQAEEKEMSIVQKVWMGGEREGWKERRRREEQKALEEGKGYGDLIKEHIWDVVTWGQKDGELGEEDEVKSGGGTEKGSRSR